MISRLYFNKNEIIVKECAGKSVLDLGIVDHDVSYEKRKNWLHKKIIDAGRRVIGIDIDRESINILKNKGYEVLYANVEDFNLKEKFEIIVAGDIIEHLNNVGKCLESIKKHMNKDSLLIITIPNCLSFSNWLELIIFGRIKYFNEEHTSWYDESTIKRILENYDFKITELSFVCHNPHFIGESKIRSLMKDIRYMLVKFLCKVRKQFSPTIYIRAYLK